MGINLEDPREEAFANCTFGELGTRERIEDEAVQAGWKARQEWVEDRQTTEWMPARPERYEQPILKRGDVCPDDTRDE